MYATLWHIMRCIMFDEHITAAFWNFARTNNLLTNAQIREKQNEPTDLSYIKFEPEEDKPYINAFFEFLKTNPIPRAPQIITELEYLRERNFKN